MGDQLTGVSLARSFGLVGTVSIVDDSPFVYGLAVELSIESHYAFDGMRSAQPLSLSLGLLTLTLFVLRVFTDYSDPAFALDDFALFADRFNR